MYAYSDTWLLIKYKYKYVVAEYKKKYIFLSQMLVNAKPSKTKKQHGVVPVRESEVM